MDYARNMIGCHPEPENRGRAESDAFFPNCIPFRPLACAILINGSYKVPSVVLPYNGLAARIEYGVMHTALFEEV